MSNANAGMKNKFQDAAEACREISSEADKIKAHYDGAAGVASALSKMTPWGALSNAVDKVRAENEVKQQVKNILQVDLSSNDIMKISNDCLQSSSIKQINSLKWDPACINSPIISEGIANGTIKLKNIKQRNKAEVENKCVMQSMIDILSKKEANAKTLAASEVLQEATNPSSNKFTGDACNVVQKDMSSNDYFENMQKCNQEAFADQTNEIFACGGMEDIAQENVSNQKNECLMKAGVFKVEDTKAQSETATDTKTKQKAEGISPAAIGGSILSCLCCCSIIFIILSMLGYFASTMEQ